MEEVLVIIGKLPEYLNAAVAVMVALIALFVLIPGDQPEKALQAVVDFIAKISFKKKQ